MKTHNFRLRLVGSLQICWIWANVNVFKESKLEQLSAHLVPSRLMMRRCIDSGQRQFGMCRASQLYAVGGTVQPYVSFYGCRLLDCSEESCCCTELWLSNSVGQPSDVRDCCAAFEACFPVPSQKAQCLVKRDESTPSHFLTFLIPLAKQFIQNPN